MHVKKWNGAWKISQKFMLPPSVGLLLPTPMDTTPLIEWCLFIEILHDRNILVVSVIKVIICGEIITNKYKYSLDEGKIKENNYFFQINV